MTNDDVIKSSTNNEKEFMQNVEQNRTAVSSSSSNRKFTPPPGDSRSSERKSSSPDGHNATIENYQSNEEIVPTKGQANLLKNRFVELEQDAKKVETASSKVKYVPKRFVDTPPPKQANIEPAIVDNKCFLCNKTVYAMEKVEADKKVYHKSCFKCVQCKSVLKPGNFTANDSKIYCKPHFLQLFAIKGNYSAGFGLNDHKARWLPNSSSSSSPSSISNTHESMASNEN